MSNSNGSPASFPRLAVERSSLSRRASILYKTIASVVVLVLVSGCKPQNRAPEHSASSSSAQIQAPSNAPSHDPSHPPIDCPLRKAGINPHGLKPFEDTEKYIAFLERADREVWQKPDAIIASLKLTGNETVVDVGAGSGYFTFRFAKALPIGHVIATDIEPEMIRHIHHRALSEHTQNVEVVLGDPADPKIPSGASLLFVCDVLHHVKDRTAWLSKLYEETPAGARLAIVEFKEGELPQGPPAAMKLPRQQVIDAVKQAGFAYQNDNSIELPYQYLLRFEKR